MGEREARRSGEKGDENQADSKKVFGLEIPDVVGATAKVYGTGVYDLHSNRRGEENDARSMPMYLTVRAQAQRDWRGIDLLGEFSVFTDETEDRDRKRLARRARDIEQLLLKSQQHT